VGGFDAKALEAFDGLVDWEWCGAVVEEWCESFEACVLLIELE
jgi:hypothetical protein